jgi:hypothetical protein
LDVEIALTAERMLLFVLVLNEESSKSPTWVVLDALALNWKAGTYKNNREMQRRD